MTHAATTLSAICWNIHRGRGEDGVVDAKRTADVLCDEVLSPDTQVLMLQEADDECPPHAGILDIEAIEARTGLRSVHTDSDTRWGPESHGFLGVIGFVHPSVAVERVSVVDMPGHCHRGAVVMDLSLAGRQFRFVGMHLSLTQVLRAVQLRTLGQYLFRQPARPTVLCGDLNEWRPWGGLALSKFILGHRYAGPAPATFPVKRPLVPLDRFLAAGGARVESATVLDGPGIRMASDHRPLAAQIVVEG